MGFFIYMGIYCMDSDKIKKSVEKYVDSIIVPKFSDIIKFSVETMPAGYPIGDTIIKIVFLMDGTEEEVEYEIEDSIEDMFKMFSFNTKIKSLTRFETK